MFKQRKEQEMSGFQFYDEGWNARVRGEPFNKNATRDWRDGWKDCDEAQESQRQLID